MTSDAPNRIAEIRKAQGMTQQALADAVGAHWITISKLERGKLPLSFDWAERLGKALGVGDFGVFKRSYASQPVFVDGMIAENGKVIYYNDEDGNEDFQAYHVELDLGRKGSTNWLEVENDNLFPFLQRNDLIQVEWISSESVDLFLDKLCIVDVRATKDQPPNMRLGFVVSGSAEKTFNLNVLNGAPIRDVNPDGIAVVTMALFSPKVWNRRSGIPDPESS